MSKQLLVDYTIFEVSPQQINESLAENGGRLIVTGVLQRAGAKNQNGRIYPMPRLQREAKNYSQTFIAERRALVQGKGCPYFSAGKDGNSLAPIGYKNTNSTKVTPFRVYERHRIATLFIAVSAGFAGLFNTYFEPGVISPPFFVLFK